MSKVLMFAGAGWLGHRIANRLQHQGFKVTVIHLAMDERFVPAISKEISHILGNINDESLCRRAVKDLKPDVVIDVHPNPSLFPRNYAILKGQIGHYLHCSSAGVYVPTAKTAVAEDAPTHAIKEYGSAFIAKKQVDEHAMAVHSDEVFPVTIVRPGVILGKGMLPLELWGLRNPQFFHKLKEGRIRVSKTSDIIMSALYVEDAANIFTQAVLQPEKSKGEIFNAISWPPFTHAQYLSAITEALGVKLEVEYISTEEVIKEHIRDSQFSLHDYNFLMSSLSVDGEKAGRVLGVHNTACLIDVLKESLAML